MLRQRLAPGFCVRYINYFKLQVRWQLHNCVCRRCTFTQPALWHISPLIDVDTCRLTAHICTEPSQPQPGNNGAGKIYGLSEKWPDQGTLAIVSGSAACCCCC